MDNLLSQDANFQGALGRNPPGDGVPMSLTIDGLSFTEVASSSNTSNNTLSPTGPGAAPLSQF